MLRPMIEGMQNNIRNQTQGSLDPFGGANSGGGSIAAHSSVTTSSHSPSPFAPSYSTAAASTQQVQHVSSTTEAITSTNFEQSLSDAIMSNIEQIISESKGVHNDLIKLNEELVSSPILLSDAGNIQGLMEKIITATASYNSESEKNDLNQLVDIISTFSVSRVIPVTDLNVPVAVDKFDTFFKLYFKDSSLQLSFLSILRYIVLQPNLCHASVPLQKIMASIVEELASPQGFNESMAKRTIAYSVLTNLVSHTAGAKLLLAPLSAEQNAIFAKAREKLVDVVTEGLGHSKSAIKMMASALAVNLTIAATSPIDATAAAAAGVMWSSSRGKDGLDLHPSAVQLLCFIIESIESENNQIIRLRELVVLFRLLKHCDAKGLANDLGLDPIVDNLVRNAHHQHQLSTSAAAAGGGNEEAELRRDEAVLIREIHKLIRIVV